MLKLRIVCATRESETAFWAVTATGQSLAKLRVSRSSVRLFPNNSEGLGTCYRQAILEARENPAILVFMHDDITLLDYFWQDTVRRMLNRFDIVGLAGSRQRLPGQAAWWCIDPNAPVQEHLEASGTVGHGPPVRVDHYGPVEQEVKLLDGLFLAADSAVLIAKGVWFDARFDFHMYDIDFSRQCERAGLRMGTAPISVIHHGAGRYDSTSWRENHQRYLQKWHEGDAPVHNHQFLKALHEDLKPRGYVEIGIYTGSSLALASCDSLGIDPHPRINVKLGGKTVVVAATSDDFFADTVRVVKFMPEHTDLAYIDGMHLAEFALRDFCNIETYANRSTVVCFDDVLPYNADIATRQPLPGDWTGDVWKVIDILRLHRPDLRMMLVNTQPTGTLVVYNLDPAQDVSMAKLLHNITDQLRHDISPPVSIIDREGCVSADEARETLKRWREELVDDAL